MNKSLFRQDLRNGMSIEDALKKHNVSFQQAFKVLSKNKKLKPKNPHQPKFIFKRKGNVHVVRKTTNGITKIYGSYNSLEDAMKVRDELIKEGWNQRSVDSICERVGVERRKGHEHSKWNVRYS